MPMPAKEPSDLSLGTVEKLEIHIHLRALPPATTNLLAWPYRRTEYLDGLQEDTNFADILLPKDSSLYHNWFMLSGSLFRLMRMRRFDPLSIRLAST